MEFVRAFSNTFLYYLQELWFSVLIGFFISGILYEFMPTRIVERFLGKKGFMPILAASAIGVVLPVCCFGSLPIAVTMQRKGARLGPVLAFLVTTPATSAPALMACWKLLGAAFTVYIFFAVIVMGLVMGLVGNTMATPQKERQDDSCCARENDGGGQVVVRQNFSARIKNIFRYGFVTLPKEIGPELLLGVAVASVIMVFAPLQHLIQQYLSGGWGYVFSLIVGLATYVCSTGSVPMADAFLKSGMTYGPAMVYLLVGPITSYGMIFAVQKAFGTKALVLYLGVICVTSILLGIGFNFMMSGTAF